MPKGQIPWNKGKPLPLKMRLALVKRNKERIGEKHYLWKGNKVGYDALHDWVARHKGIPSVCEKCKGVFNSRYKIHWANKSGKYIRDLEDWIALCVSCHTLFDKNYLRRKRNARGQFMAV